MAVRGQVSRTFNTTSPDRSGNRTRNGNDDSASGFRAITNSATTKNVVVARPTVGPVSEPRPHPVALSIGGLDPTGTVGLLVDAAAFGALDVHATAVITVVTAQNTGSAAIAQVVAEAINGFDTPWWSTRFWSTAPVNPWPTKPSLISRGRHSSLRGAERPRR